MVQFILLYGPLDILTNSGKGLCRMSLPIYRIYQYTENVYKVVNFKRASSSSEEEKVYLRDSSAFEHYDIKLDAAYSRARSEVLQYALCNPWTHFFTGTIDKTKIDRFSVDAYMLGLTQFIRDQRKKYGIDIQFLIIPEKHANGAYHSHGLLFFSDWADVLRCFDKDAPYKLRLGKFMDWPDYRAKFGFCSLAPIRKLVASAFYIAKYIGKGVKDRSEELGKHLYFHSRPLNRSFPVSDVLIYNKELDAVCVHDYDFLKTGFAIKDWSFPISLDGADYELLPLEVEDIEENELIPEFFQERLY